MQQNTTDKRAKYIPKYRHEINILYGDCFLLEFFSNINNANYDHNAGTLSATYIYHKNRWFSIGATCSYIPSYRHYNKTTFNENPDGSLSDINKHTVRHKTHFSSSVEVQFSFFREDWVRLYGGVSGGLMLNVSKDEDIFLMVPSIQATFFGFQFGKRFIGGGELGVGTKGFFNCYIGYKF
jgi:hypothetical protein